MKLNPDWQRIVQHVAPDEIAVFASCIMSQLDENGFGGMMQSRLKGGRVTAKQLALGLNTMPADFINKAGNGVTLPGTASGQTAWLKAVPMASPAPIRNSRMTAPVRRPVPAR